MKTRNNNSYSSLEEIINALSKNPHASSVWVGENYSKADLIEDLNNILKEYYLVYKKDLVGKSSHNLTITELPSHSMSAGILSDKWGDE